MMRPDTPATVTQSLPVAATGLAELDQAETTRTSYRGLLKQFVLAGGQLPATPHQIIHYLEAHLGEYSVSTHKLVVAALSDWHRRHRFPDPITADVRRALRAIGRIKRRQPVRKALPLSLHQVQQLVNACQQDRDPLRGLRDSALVLVGFAAALRRSELCQLHWGDIAVEDSAVYLHLKHSKTDQLGEGSWIKLPRIATDYCPAQSLEQWLQRAGIAEGPIFRRIGRDRQLAVEPLHPGSVNRILKSRARQAGLAQWQRISGHSLRRGFATDAARRGVNLTDLAAAGRWQRLDTLKEYVETENSRAFEAVFGPAPSADSK